MTNEKLKKIKEHINIELMDKLELTSPSQELMRLEEEAVYQVIKESSGEASPSTPFGWRRNIAKAIVTRFGVPKVGREMVKEYLIETLTKIPQDTGYYSTSNLINKIRREFLEELIKEIKIKLPHQP